MGIKYFKRIKIKSDTNCLILFCFSQNNVQFHNLKKEKKKERKNVFNIKIKLNNDFKY